MFMIIHTHIIDCKANVENIVVEMVPQPTQAQFCLQLVALKEKV